MSHRYLGAAFTALLLVFSPLTQGSPEGDIDLPAGLDIAGMDRSVTPGDNFFLFANGGWLKAHEIPADRGSYGTWGMLHDLTEKRLAQIIQQAAGSASTSPEARLISNYYAAFMDEDRIEALGLRPLDPIRSAIAAISSRRALASYLGGTLRADVDVLNFTHVHTDNVFGLWIAQDLDHPQRYVPFVLQGGLAMPDRSYYLDPSAAMTAVRAKYATHVAEVFRLLGVGEPIARANRVIALEQKIAATHSSRAETEDVLKGNNRWQRNDFPSKAPGLDWGALFTAAQLPVAQQDFIVWHPGAVTGIAALVASEPLGTWKDYLLFHAVENRGWVLSKAVVDERFSFYGKVLEGAPEQRARWKRGVAATDRALGDAVGKLYVARYFPPAAKARLQAMVEHIRAAFDARIDHLDWMAPQTKASAKAKLAALKVGVGYPDSWRDYSALKILPDDAYGNAERASLFDYHQELSKLARPVDRSEWALNPQTVNAINLPAMNALNFPAAALQPPFFNVDGDPAQNYGAIGTIMGHEISHSFDDQGATFDADGRLRNWWTDHDLAHFKASGQALAAQFSAYRPFPDLAVNGEQTLSENIADVAGLAAAFDAYNADVQQRSADVVDGYSGTQRFFLAFAQNWRSKFREPTLRRIVLTDGHAPDEYRARTVRNSDAWYMAFNVRAGQELYLEPAQRVHVW